MADRILDANDLIASLHDIRLPSQAAGGQIAEVLAALGVGLLLAFICSLLLPFVTKLVPKARPLTIQQRVKSLRSLPEEERKLALMHLLKETESATSTNSWGNIYAIGGLPKISDLEAKVLGGEMPNV